MGKEQDNPAQLMNPAVLRWARERAALQPDVAAKRIGVDPPTLLAWESGSAFPTLSKLRKAASVYKRPLAVFFLPEVPQGYTVINDYRVPAGSEEAGNYTPELVRAIRTVRERRDSLLDMVEEAPDPFAMSATLADDVDDVARMLRRALGVSAEEQFAFREPRLALARWILAVERLNVLVFQEGGIAEGVMRGLSIPEQPLPIVLLNGGDRHRGRIFTLLHELVHITLRQSAVCTLDEHQRAETYCNRVAAGILMPSELLLQEALVRPRRSAAIPWTDEELDRLASKYAVSQEAMLLRLVALGKASRSFYEEMQPIFHERYAADRKRRKARKQQANYWRVFMRDRGARYVRAVLEAYYDERATIADVTGSLGIRARQIPRVEQEAFAPES